jgi:hypothetical protein
MLIGALQAPTNVRGAWVVDEQDRCVNEWRASDLLRGPIAITNSPFLPLRSVAGGLLFVLDETRDGKIWKVPLYGTTSALVCGTFGLLESAEWVCTGFADTVTGGYFELAPDDAINVSLFPVPPPFIPDARRPAWSWGWEDRCGRRIIPEPPPPPTPGPLPAEKLRK